MTTPDTPGDNRSVQIGGSVTGSAVVTGDSNTVSVQFQQASLPAPETVDIRAMLISGVWRDKKEGRILLDEAKHQTRNTP